MWLYIDPEGKKGQKNKYQVLKMVFIIFSRIKYNYFIIFAYLNFIKISMYYYFYYNINFFQKASRDNKSVYHKYPKPNKQFFSTRSPFLQEEPSCQ